MYFKSKQLMALYFKLSWKISTKLKGKFLNIFSYTDMKTRLINETSYNLVRINIICALASSFLYNYKNKCLNLQVNIYTVILSAVLEEIDAILNDVHTMFWMWIGIILNFSYIKLTLYTNSTLIKTN